MTSANKHMMQMMMHSPRGLPPRIFSLLLMPRCKRPHLGIHKLQWRCREKPEYQYNKIKSRLSICEMENTKFSNLRISDWRQVRNIWCDGTAMQRCQLHNSLLIWARSPSSSGDSWCRLTAGPRASPPGDQLWRLCLEREKWTSVILRTVNINTVYFVLRLSWK